MEGQALGAIPLWTPPAGKGFNSAKHVQNWLWHGTGHVLMGPMILWPPPKPRNPPRLPPLDPPPPRDEPQLLLTPVPLVLNLPVVRWVDW